MVSRNAREGVAEGLAALGLTRQAARGGGTQVAYEYERLSMDPGGRISRRDPDGPYPDEWIFAAGFTDRSRPARISGLGGKSDYDGTRCSSCYLGHGHTIRAHEQNIIRHLDQKAEGARARAEGTLRAAYGGDETLWAAYDAAELLAEEYHQRRRLADGRPPAPAYWEELTEEDEINWGIARDEGRNEAPYAGRS